MVEILTLQRLRVHRHRRQSRHTGASVHIAIPADQKRNSKKILFSLPKVKLYHAAAATSTVVDLRDAAPYSDNGIKNVTGCDRLATGTVPCVALLVSVSDSSGETIPTRAPVVAETARALPSAPASANETVALSTPSSGATAFDRYFDAVDTDANS